MTRPPDPTPSLKTSGSIFDRIDEAIRRVTNGVGPMRIPADPSGDADLVLGECRDALAASQTAWDELHAALGTPKGANAVTYARTLAGIVTVARDYMAAFDAMKGVTDEKDGIARLLDWASHGMALRRALAASPPPRSES